MKYFLLFMLILLPRSAKAETHAAIESYVSDDVVAIAYLDLSQIDTLGGLEWAEKLGWGPSKQERGQAVKFMLALQQWLDKFADLGVRYIYALFRVSDVSFGGPTWVVPVSNAEHTRAVMGMILSGRPDNFSVERDLRPGFIPEHWEVVEHAVLGATSPEQLELLRAQIGTQTRDLSDAWERLGAGHCGLLVLGDKDSRRVVHELFPQLPKPFQAVDGELIANHLRWGGMVADLPPAPRLELWIQTDSSATAQALQITMNDGTQLLDNLLRTQPNLSRNDREALLGRLASQLKGSQLVIRFHGLLADLPRIARIFAPSVRAARQASIRKERISKFKRLALAPRGHRLLFGKLHVGVETGL